MKRRVRKIANFFAFNLLFFALYLNFIHKDKSSAIIAEPVTARHTPAFSGTVLVETPENFIEKKTTATEVTEEIVNSSTEETDEPLKLSIN